MNESSETPWSTEEMTAAITAVPAHQPDVAQNPPLQGSSENAAAETLDEADGKLPVLSNRSNDKPVPPDASQSYIEYVTHGWPKVVGNSLYYPLVNSQGRKTAMAFKDASDLFAWLAKHFRVSWVGAKPEFYRFLEQNCTKYVWATDLPHLPELPGVLYTHPAPAPQNNGRLHELVAMFDLHTEEDRLLTLAFILTVFWGGPKGKRPLFVFSTAEFGQDADVGRGAGKSTIVQKIASLAGGCISLQKDGSSDRFLSDVLSPAAASIRMVLLDNVKSLKLSDSFLESIVTGDEIDGHQLYAGHAKRPNYLTFALTANEPMLSKDLATRSIPILLNQAKKSPEWDEKISTMLENPTFIMELHADILYYLSLPPTGKSGSVAGDGGEEYDRWSLWWRDVASKVCPDSATLETLIKLVKERRGAVDQDLDECRQVEDAIRNAIRSSGSRQPDDVAVFFPTKLLPKVLADVFGKDARVITVGRRLRQLPIRNLCYTESGYNGARGYWWIGIKYNPDTSTCLTFRCDVDPDHREDYKLQPNRFPREQAGFEAAYALCRKTEKPTTISVEQSVALPSCDSSGAMTVAGEPKQAGFCGPTEEPTSAPDDGVGTPEDLSNLNLT